jgi:hypothetical protein
MRIRTIGWRRKLDLLIDVRIKDLAKLIAYLNTGCAPASIFPVMPLAWAAPTD